MNSAKTVTIRWQRLVDDNDQTHPRCRETGETVKKAFEKLKKALFELGIEVEITEKNRFPFIQPGSTSVKSHLDW